VSTLTVQTLEHADEGIGLAQGGLFVHPSLRDAVKSSSARSTLPVTLSASTSVCSAAARSLGGPGWLRATATAAGSAPTASVAMIARVPAGPRSRRRSAQPVLVR
jgi:hypothetical protein